jgi:hypothetical protein
MFSYYFAKIVLVLLSFESQSYKDIISIINSLREEYEITNSSQERNSTERGPRE